MKNKIHKYLYGSWLLTLTLLLAVSATASAKTDVKTQKQNEVELTQGQSLNLSGISLEQNSNRPMTYCIPEGTNSNRHINNFSTTGGTQDISNMASGFSAGGYGDFYDTHTLAQEPGEDVEFTVDIVGGTAGFRIWVDWNQDNVFDTTEEVAYNTSSYGNSHTGSFTVPADALTGDTRMRIVSHWLSSSGSIDPCATGFTYGEFEDYKFTVEGGGAPVVYCIPEGTNSNRYINNFSTTGGTQDVSNMASGFSAGGYGDFYDTHTLAQEPGEDVEFTVDIVGGTAGFRVWVDWNQDGVFDTTEEVAYASSSYANSHTGSFTVPADALEGDTRMRIVSHWLSSSGNIDPCETGFTYGEFEDYKFTVEGGGGAPVVYCIPEGTNSNRYIDNFSTTGGTQDVSNMASGFSAGGYGDFYDTHTLAQEPGEDVEFTVDIVGGTAGFRVWVDWNQDGVFDTTEEVAYASSSYASSHTGSFTVPADAMEGDTRMRIVSHWLSSSGSIDPCETGFTYGEFEDYKFTVEGAGGAPVVYCTPAGTNSSYYINSFSTTGATTDISNLNSGFSAGGYGDFYDTHTVEQAAGEDVEFLAEFPSGQTYGFRIWVDWNQDGVFDTTEEVAWNSSTYDNPHSGSFTVPADALEGETRMRVVGHWLNSSANIDPCATDHTYGEFEDYKFIVGAGAGSGDDCSLATVGVFENGKSFNKTLDRIVAQDMVVPADQNMMLEKINLNAFIGDVGAGVNAANTDIYVYEDDGGIPGALVTMIADVVPTSQTIIGEAFGYQAWDVELDFAAVELAGQEGAATTYWIGVSLEATDASNSFWEFYSDATAPVVGHGLAYDDGIAGFIIEAENEGVYTFHATCSDIGGGGGGSGSITTIFDGGNNGTAGGAVYFDVNVGPEDIELTALDLNINNVGTTFSVEVYTLEGTYVGNETNQASWTLRTEGSGTSAGEGNASNAPLDDTFVLSANTTYGMALVIDNTHSHYYTNGDGSNEHFENGDLSLDLGAATNVPFTPSVFAPRIFNGTLYYNVGGGGGGGTACEQVFYDDEQPTGIGFSSGNIVANDITVAAGESFTLQTMTFDVVNIDGEPSEFDLEIFEDNGNGGVGASTGITHYFDSSNMTFVENGTFSVYTQYTVTLTLPNIELTADASEDARYWLAVAAELSTTGDFTYWVSYDYVTNPDSYPTWQYTPSVGSWFEYVDSGNLLKEGIMTVSGTCGTGGGDPGITYCEPELDCTDGDVITNVTFQEIDNTTACSPNGYGDYTHLTATVESGGTYPISVTVGDGWSNESVSVWIDFDNSGTFDEDEFFFIGTGSDEVLLGDIDIPADLADGEYRMRVRVAAVGSGTATWDMSCDETQGYGETEDYTVVVDGVVGIDDQSMTAFTYFPNPTSDILNITANKDISSVAVYNLLGQQVLALDRLDNGQVDVSALATGSYMFRVLFEDGSMEVFKVLKE